MRTLVHIQITAYAMSCAMQVVDAPFPHGLARQYIELRAAGAIDADLIYGGGLIDKTKVKVDDAGAVTGLDEIIAELQKNKAHLFKAAGSDVPPGTGKDGDEDFKGVNTREDFLKLSAEQQLAFKQANPAAFKQFLSAN